MKRTMVVATALTLSVLAVSSNRATAQTFNTQERTFLTFNAPVELPGVVLQPGIYVFKLADTGSRNIVQVWNTDGDARHRREHRMIGHWNFIQADRREMADETIVLFKETRVGSTPAVQYWYFPGERIGKEFVYPKDQAERIAARTGATVQSTSGAVTARLAVAEPEPASAPPEEVALEAAPVPAPVEPVAAAPVPEPAAVVEEGRVAAAAPEPAPRAVGTSGVADELPQTNSPLALIGLIGLLSLAGSAGVRVSRN